MLKDLVAWTTDPGDLVLDFYAGSCTTAHAILELNLNADDARRFIMVNLPEPTPIDSPAREAGYETVSEIGWARIVMAAEALGVDGFGMRCLALGESNFKVWDAAQAPVEGDALAEQLTMFADSLRSTATNDGIAAEVLLKEGVPLDVPWDRRRAANQHLVVAGKVAVCLAKSSSPELVAALLELEVDKIIVLDSAFNGRDTDKANLLIGAGKAGIQVRAV
jgi:adenine-specific DNA-methyltransferase